jgi:hypothetical protein
MPRQRPANLDKILSEAVFFAGKRTPTAKSNQSRDLLHFLLCRLYEQSHGDLGRAQLAIAQSRLARELGLSRRWVGLLLKRLQQAGWIEYTAKDGRSGSTVFRAGSQVKRLLQPVNPHHSSVVVTSTR